MILFFRTPSKSVIATEIDHKPSQDEIGSMPASFRACICSLRSIPNAADRPAAPAPTITSSYISSTCFGLIATIFAQGVTSLRFAGWRVCRCMRGYACLMRMFSMDSVDLCRLGGGVVGRDVMWRLRR